RPAAAVSLLLAQRRQGLPQRLDEAHPGIRTKRDRRIRIRRIIGQDHGHGANSFLELRTGQHARLVLREILCSPALPAKCFSALRRRLCGCLLVSDGTALPKKYLPEDLIPRRRTRVHGPRAYNLGNIAPPNTRSTLK